MTLPMEEEFMFLKEDWKGIKSLLEEKNRHLDELTKKCALYEKISRDRAQRKRKNVSDPSGYSFIASREIIDYYDKPISKEKKERVPILAYKTTLSMPYPPQLGFSELRRLLIADLLGEKASSYGIEETTCKDGLILRTGINRFALDFPADGKNPGPLDAIGWDPRICLLYRVVLNIGKKFPETDLYTTQPLDIPAEMME